MTDIFRTALHRDPTSSHSPRRSVVTLAAAALLLASCRTAEDGRLLLPIGRLVQAGNSIAVSVDSKPYRAHTVADGCGGYWLALPFRDLKDKAEIGVTVVKRDAANYAPEGTVDMVRWTSASRLIDSGDPAIAAKAGELTQGATGVNEKAQRILRFVVRSVGFTTYSGMHLDSASATLARGEGICVNHSRLFVALCRASGIASRTISGTNLSENGAYFHHEWAEFYDEQGRWHPLDPTMSGSFEFTDLNRIDLVYDIESNPVYPFDRGWEVDRVSLDRGDVSVFCTDWSVQRRSGKMSYALVPDPSPDTVTARVTYRVSRYRR
jgi:hypothetical protein